MLANLQRYFQLERRDRRALARVWWSLLWFDLRIRLRDALDWPEVGEPPTRDGACELTLDELERWKWRVDVASRFHVPGKSCLVKAACLRYWLRKRGCPAMLRIGVRRSPIDRALEGHAWVEVSGEVLGEPAVEETRYAPLRSVGSTGLGALDEHSWDSR